MPKVEVLVAALGCVNGMDLYRRMKIETDAVIANQCGENSHFEYDAGGKCLKVISAMDRGVGKNRNLAIIHSTGDILVFADDDIVYKKGYARIIGEAFESLPKADAIVFNINDLNPRTKRADIITRIRKINITCALKYGIVQVAVRRSALLKANVWFSLLFGGGAPYCAGEDTLFIRQMLRAGLNIYTHPSVIADAPQETSTWFTGHNEAYFHDRGALLAALFPKMSLLFSIIYAFRYQDRTDEYTPWQIWRFLRRGIWSFKRGERFVP
ncbi:MAG: glycosyltransferase family A protein [Eubacteriales bacterium]|jgi:glycosyltransferase involved in cell wall biosynthesis|nr:glycosyltransferase family A protein [Eubacteriales bacterium]